MNVKSFIREVQDYPEPGVSFKDITTLISNVDAFQFTVNSMEKFISKDIQFLASIDSRGFLFGSVLAYQLGLPNILLRKKGKLPPPVISKSYSLEYGNDVIEAGETTMPKGKSIMIIDDLIASGGSARAASDLLVSCENEVKGICVVVKLEYLHPNKLFKNNIFSVCSYS
jgi:adenine phosphoribosyltransferase